jgi:hypothetical protein
MCDRERATLVAAVFLVRIVESFEEGLLLMRRVLVGLRLWKLFDAAVGHGLSPEVLTAAIELAQLKP